MIQASALNEAATEGDGPMIEILIRHGACVNGADSLGVSTLHNDSK